MTFLNSLQKNTNKKFTENGAVTNKSSLNPVLDFFAQAGAMRGRVSDAVKLFERAYISDPLLALRALFYLRDVRGGQGERDLFRACLPVVSPAHLDHNIQHVPEFGRWDDILSLPLAASITIIRDQITKDLEAMNVDGGKVSLLAKWLPSENTSSKETRTQAKSIREGLEMDAKTYRKTLSKLRKHIKLLEQNMSANKWDEIQYDKIPSQAHRKHVKAFKRHDETRYAEFIGAVEKGEKKINTGTLFTYEVFDLMASRQEETANAMWKNLPDYTQGNNALVMADVSGSMMGRPMSISVSLALYFAERNTGPFNGYFMTFSAEPQLVKVEGETLRDKLRMIENAQWDMNTNLEAAFDTILQSAIDSGAQGDDMPKILYIISDMEFDRCVANSSDTIFENARKKFEANNLKLPHVVFWNVDSRQDQAPALSDDSNVTLISGSSQSTFRHAVEGKTPIELMNDVLNSERYAIITL